jgi:hypothetical protein
MSNAVTIISIDTKHLHLSDGTKLECLPKIHLPKSWGIGDEVEVTEMKMKMCKILNISKNKTIGEAFLVKGPDSEYKISIQKSKSNDYPQTHWGVIWTIEELIQLDKKILLNDGSFWSVSDAFTAIGRESDWEMGQEVEITPLSRGNNVGRPMIRAYSILNKSINRAVTGKFIGFRE